VEFAQTYVPITMSQPSNPKRPAWLYLVLAWMVLNLILMALMIPGDSSDLNNYIEVILWAVSIGLLATIKKAGAAFAISVLCITLGTSMFNVLIGYYQNMLGEAFVSVNALRIVINAAIVVYMFRAVFEGKFK
jgi:hypothetical protein